MFIFNRFLLQKIGDIIFAVINKQKIKSKEHVSQLLLEIYSNKNVLFWYF